jgi:hypothetical protein
MVGFVGFFGSHRPIDKAIESENEEIWDYRIREMLLPVSSSGRDMGFIPSSITGLHRFVGCYAKCQMIIATLAPAILRKTLFQADQGWPG